MEGVPGGKLEGKWLNDKGNKTQKDPLNHKRLPSQLSGESQPLIIAQV